MLKIAIYHQSQSQRKKLSEVFADCLKEMRLCGKLYLVQDFRRFSENVLNGNYQFPVICMDTTDKERAQKLMAHNFQNTEFILIDTPAKEVARYMKYKPAAWVCGGEEEKREIREALQACLYHLHKKKEECFCIHTKTKSIRIPYRQILYLESRLHQVIVHTVRPEDVCAFAAVLDDVEKVLPKENFYRCHQSFLVNIDSIAQLDRTNRRLILCNKEILGISKRYYKESAGIFHGEAAI